MSFQEGQELFSDALWTTHLQGPEAPSTEISDSAMSTLDGFVSQRLFMLLLISLSENMPLLPELAACYQA